MKRMPRQTARFAIVETGYIPSHQRNATPNEVVRTETGCIPSLPPGTDLLAAGGHKTRPYSRTICYTGVLAQSSILASLIFVATRQSPSKLDSALAAPKMQFSIFNLQFSIFNLQSSIFN